MIARVPSSREVATLQGPLGRRLRRHRSAVLERAFAVGVSDVRVFGSVARGEDTADSDVDLLVHLPPHMGLIGVARLERALEEILDAPVEVIPDEGLKTDVSRVVRREAVPL